MKSSAAFAAASLDVPPPTDRTLDAYNFVDSLVVPKLILLCNAFQLRRTGLKKDLLCRLKRFITDSPTPALVLQHMKTTLSDETTTEGLTLSTNFTVSPISQTSALQTSGLASEPSKPLYTSTSPPLPSSQVLSQGVKRPRDTDVAEPIRRSTASLAPKAPLVGFNSILSYVAQTSAFKQSDLPPFVPLTEEALLSTGCERVPGGVSSCRCLCGSIIRPLAPAVRCSSLTCGVFAHPECLLYTPQSRVSTRWRCPTCRAAMMMPFSIVLNVGGATPTLVWKSAPRLPIGSLTPSYVDRAKGPFDSSWLHPAGNEYSVRLICMDLKLEHEAICTWPQNFSLFVNDNPINVPQAAPGARSAPLLDISSMCIAEKINVVRLRPHEIRSTVTTSADRPFPSTHCILTPIVKAVSITEIINFMLEDRCLDVNFAKLAMRASLEISRRPGGHWKGVSSYDLCGIRSLWEHERKGCTMRASTRDSIVLNKVIEEEKLTGSTQPILETNDVEVENESFSLTLRDPVSMLPLGIPVRGDACKHTQCIDLSAFLRMNKASSAPRWKCPICSRPLMPHQLWIDSYMCLIIRSVMNGKNSSTDVEVSTILSSTPSDEKVRIGPLGLSNDGLGIPSYLATAQIEILDDEWRLGKGMTIEKLLSDHKRDSASSSSYNNNDTAEDLMGDSPLLRSPVKRIAPVATPKEPTPSNVIDLTMDEDVPRTSPLIPPSLIRL